MSGFNCNVRVPGYEQQVIQCKDVAACSHNVQRSKCLQFFHWTRVPARGLLSCRMAGEAGKHPDHGLPEPSCTFDTAGESLAGCSGEALAMK